jgi:hypothetical protein
MAEDMLSKVIAGLDYGLGKLAEELRGTSAVTKLLSPGALLASQIAEGVGKVAAGGSMLMPSGVSRAADVKLGGMSHSELVQLRAANTKDNALNVQVSPYEHRAFSREFITDATSNAEAGLRAVSLSAAIPAYYVSKATGVQGVINSVSGETGTTTPPSLEQVLAGYKGVGEGVTARFKM